jgi:hypothetical protein
MTASHPPIMAYEDHWSQQECCPQPAGMWDDDPDALGCGCEPAEAPEAPLRRVRAGAKTSVSPSVRSYSRSLQGSAIKCSVTVRAPNLAAGRAELGAQVRPVTSGGADAVGCQRPTTESDRILVSTVREGVAVEELRALVSSGCAMATTVAWEMARMSAGPLLAAADAGAVARIEDSAYEQLRTAAAAQIAALGMAPAVMPDLRTYMEDRATLAVALHQAAALLLRDRRVPWAFGSHTLSRRIATPLRTITARVDGEAPSANHAQALLDRHQTAFMASVRRLGTTVHAAILLGADEALVTAAAQDFAALTRQLVDDQPAVRAAWLPTAMCEVGEALAVLELSAESNFDDALQAFGRVATAILGDLPGESQGPRRRWLGVVAALESLARSEDLADRQSLSDQPTAVMAKRRLVGRYEVQHEIARGGMATVFAARDTRLDRVIALKVTPAGAAGDVRSRFAREVRLSARLEHPNIVGVYDAGEDGGRSWLAMRLVAGPSLAAILTAGPLTAERASARFAELTDALAHVHEHGIVHRDIKPSNILIETLGPTGERAVMTDFGIAQTADEWATRSGLVAGTPGWIAPEVAAGQRAGPPTDVWALAHVYLAMLTADPSGDTRPDELGALLGAAHADWIRRALDNDPARRPALLRRAART